MKKFITTAATVIALTAMAQAEPMPLTLQGQWCMMSGDHDDGNFIKAKNVCKENRPMVYVVHPQGFMIKFANTQTMVLCVPNKIEFSGKGWDVIADCGADDLSTPVKRFEFTFASYKSEIVQISKR